MGAEMGHIGIEQLAAKIADQVRGMTDGDRVYLLYALGRHFCRECGGMYGQPLREGEQGCQCWNDE